MSTFATTLHYAVSRVITGPPNGPVLFCTLSSVGVVVCNAHGRSAAAGPGAWPVRRPTLQGGTVRLRPVRAHLVCIISDATRILSFSGNAVVKIVAVC